MLQHREPREPPHDPEEILAGVCRVCGHRIEALRRSAKVVRGVAGVPERPFVECPYCRAGSPSHTGGRVYLGKKTLTTGA